MTQTLNKYANYVAQFQALEAGPASRDPAWLREIRAHAWSRFAELGLPTARRGNERWKYTNIAPIANATFGYPLEGTPDGAVKAEALRQRIPWQEDWVNLVFVDGAFSAALSTAPATDGVRAGNLADAIASEPASGQEVVRQHLAQHVSVDDDGFAALNTAFLRDGAFVHVPDDFPTQLTIHLAFLTTGREQPAVSYPRTLVVAGRHTRLSVVESYIGLGQNRYFTNAVTEIVLGDGAKVDHYRLLLESPEAFHVGASRVYQGQDSAFTSGAFSTGAALARNDFQVLLDAPGGFCSLNGLYLTTGAQHIDNLISIDHARPHCTSRLYYKGILDGNSRAVFGGTVLVRKDAQKTDAQQTDKNLLLSEQAEVDSKPSLLIYADDVKCGHGATAGHIDQDTVFYMRSRGLDPETASRILIHAFANEIIETVQLGPLRDYLDHLFMGAIPTASLRFGGGA